MSSYTNKKLQKRLKNITKRLKKRSHGRSKILKSTRNTLKRKTGIGMKKLKLVTHLKLDKN